MIKFVPLCQTIALKKGIYIGLLSTALILLSARCDTNNGREIPYVRVDLHLNLYGELGNLPVGTLKVVDGGVNGIIIYRAEYNLFYAYDRTCTLWPDHNEQVKEDEEFSGVFTCPECQSKYLISQGADPIAGPATFGLKEYYTVLDGSLLHVYN
mgnify:FL=1